MKVQPRSLKWQTVIILIGTLLLSHLIAIVVYSADRSETLATADALDLAERIAGYAELAAERSGERRRAVLDAANSRDLRAEIGTPPYAPDCAPHPLQAELQPIFDAALPDGVEWAACMTPSATSFASTIWNATMGNPHRGTLTVDFRFPDGQLSRFEGLLRGSRSFLADISLLYILFSVAMVGTTAYVLVGRATKPLKAFAAQAADIGRELDAPPLDEDGPREVRAAARAFNQMQHRLQRLISSRTEMLAAISHDMRTPMARLRLRLEFLEDEKEREPLLKALAEIETMSQSVLQFLRGSTPTEPARDVDIAALVDSICADMAATGLPVTFEDATSSLRLRCRPGSLRRALENLIDNAVRYGGEALVSVTSTPDEVRIVVQDEGPGIPEDEMERMVQPFIRGEQSRSRDTGGYGLGLSTALTIAHAHGGNLLMENMAKGGLRATLVLPRS